MEQDGKTKNPTLIQKWEKLFLNIGSDPTKTLTRAYVLALSLIAVMSVGIHTVSSHVSDSQRDSTQVAYQLNKQRTQMQQILVYASHYNKMGDPLDLRFMFQSLQDMRQSHDFLLNKANESGISGGYKSPALVQVYFNAPYTLAKNISDYNDLVDNYLENNEKNQNDQREKLIQQMTFMYTNMVQPAMDVALASYQKEIIQKIERYHMFQLMGVCLILFVLFAEAMLIFRPLISRIGSYNKLMKKYALEDALTGLNNRRAFLSMSESELKRATREGEAITIALMDLDHFKKVNDNYGHDVGDLVLKHFSKTMKESLRAGDIIGRIGGEEFAILFPKTTSQNARKVLEKLRHIVETSPCVFQNEAKVSEELSYTVSIGYTSLDKVQKNTSIEALLKTADEALYKTKGKGRNGITAETFEYTETETHRDGFAKAAE